MTATNVRVQMQQRRDTAANWTAAGPTLLAGEIGYETDTGKIKIGDGATAWASLAYLPIPDSTGELDVDLTLAAQSDLRFADADSSNWVAFQAPATVSSNVTWTLPDADGSDGQVLKTDGSGALDWVSPSVSGPILESQQTISADYTLTTGYNGFSAGSVEVATTYAVTVPAGATWVIV